MVFVLVNKRDLSPESTLTAEAEEAIRRVLDGSGNEAQEALALAVMRNARARGLWVGCDCRSEDGRRPAVAPCCNHRGTDYWRVLGGRHVPHDEHCIFHRTHARCRDEGSRNRPPRKAPEGYFGVLRDRAEEQRVSQPGGRSDEGGERTGVWRSAMSQRLLMLSERTGLNRLPQAGAAGNADRWLEAIREQATEIEIAPGRPLSDLWFPHVGMWNRRQVHARVRAAAKDWPADHKPQGFLCWVVWDVDAHGVGTEERNNRVEVVSAVGRPVIGGNPVRPPYLFLGAVGLRDAQIGYECLAACAHPIVTSDCPVPVDSHYERRAFGTLRTTLKVLQGAFPDAGFEIEKPVFEIGTAQGPCLPDFLIRARRGGDVATFVVEVMGFDRPDYLRGKEVTHPRMETLGTLCTMQAGAFDRPSEGLRAEGRKVTETIQTELRRRWPG